jgi:hypothetical protein
MCLISIYTINKRMSAHSFFCMTDPAYTDGMRAIVTHVNMKIFSSFFVVLRFCNRNTHDIEVVPVIVFAGNSLFQISSISVCVRFYNFAFIYILWLGFN